MLALITFTIGSLLTLAALIVLLRYAFRASMLWGVLGLLFAFPLYIFALFQWSEVPIRKTVYISLVGILAMLVGISGGALSHLTFLPEHEVVSKIEEKIAPPKETPLPNEAAAQAVEILDEENYDPLLTGGEFEGVKLDEMSPPASIVVNDDSIPNYEEIEFTEIERAVNKRVKLVLVSDDEIEGTLTHHHDESIIVESFVSGGAIGYSYLMTDIKTLSVLDLEQVIEEAEDELTPVLENVAQ